MLFERFRGAFAREICSSDLSVGLLANSYTVVPESTYRNRHDLQRECDTSGGFNGTVNFSVSGLPSGATATFNPTSVMGLDSLPCL